MVILAKARPALMPPLPESERKVTVPEYVKTISATARAKVLPALVTAIKGRANAGVPTARLVRELGVTLMPAIVFAVLMGLTWHALTKPDVVTDTAGLLFTNEPQPESTSGLQEPPSTEGGLQEPPAETTEPAGKAQPEAKAPATKMPPDKAAAPAEWHRIAAPASYWWVLGIGTLVFVAFYAIFTFTRLEVFKMLLASFFPLAVLILAVLGTIVFGLATPTEAAAVGAFGGFVLAAVYQFNALPKEKRGKVAKVWIPLWVVGLTSVAWFLLLQAEVLESGPPMWVGWASILAVALWCVFATFQVNLAPTVRESVYLTAKTSAMVCWLFVGASIFSAAFAL